MRTPINRDHTVTRGFALVIVLSLMILLTVVAVGLLTLSSISLRSAAQGDAMATARANARLALVLAIGQLQKGAGPDQRVTARADLLDQNSANPRLTGVWDSWEFKPGAPPKPEDFEKAAKDEKFRSWLVSGTDPAGLADPAFATRPPESPATLWGEGTLGKDAPATSLVKAAKVPFEKQAGALAWAVLDEGVKARINTSHDDLAAAAGTSTGRKTGQLGGGTRPGVEYIDGLETLEGKFFEKDSPEFATLQKGITGLNYALAGETLAPGVREALQPFAHDLTTLSLGLFTDTASGGLRHDFDLLAGSATLPAEYNGKGIYASRLGLAANNAPSDPRWESLQQFARLYRDDAVPKITNVGGVPLLKAQSPKGWFAATVLGDPPLTAVKRNPPPGVVLMPNIAKVEMVFSLIGRDLYGGLPPPNKVGGPLTQAQKQNMIHGPQDGLFRDTKYNYDLHLLYTPIVTLHNPYNVALEFNTLRVEFIHLPFAMKIYRSGQSQTADLIPMEQMTADNENGSRGKTFALNLKTKANGVPGSPTFKLLPGEVKMFSPYINPNLNYLDRGSYWDIWLGSSKTANMDAMPGWPGDGVGFDLDWVAGNRLVDQDNSKGHWGGCVGLAWDDQIYVEFSPISLPISGNKFTVNMTANVGTPVAKTVVSSIDINYEKTKGLEEFMSGNGVQMPLRYPKKDAVPNYVLGKDLVDRCETPIKAMTRMKAFALFSLQAKTTSGGISSDEDNVDGRLATKPWSFAHASIGGSTQKVIKEHSANFSHDVDLQLLPGNPDDRIEVDSQDRTNFITGHTANTGRKFGVQYEIPIAPVQTLAGLNGANPGGSSGYLPRFAQPIGNSWAHPLINPDKMMQIGLDGYNLLDHSFLLNTALYDKFYFSGLAEQTGAFGNGKKTETLADNFSQSLGLDDPRLVFNPQAGKPASSFAADVALPDAYARVAARQMMIGAFNVNSTSVAAWKAMLASIRDADAMFTQLNPNTATTSLAKLPAATSGEEARISRFRLPASTSAADGALDPKAAYWLGPRELTDYELQTLAERIVEQVRLRGPFLSMAEFVNRRLGPASDDMAQRGALQQAIDDAGLNAALATAAGAGFEITQDKVAKYKYANPIAGTGSSYQGAPGYLTQADILSVLGNAATARSDTFSIRGYGEARDASGEITAQATCEGVVQRYPEWIDPADPVEAAPASLGAAANQTFGRRFLVTSFRWLNPKEI